MTATYFVQRRHIPEEIVPGHRLGRHFHYDSRSAAYAYRRDPARELAAVLHKRDVPILDQGNVGSCTGNAMTGCLGTDPVFGDLPPAHPTLDEAEALKLYSAAETIDGDGPYPPNDNGSSGTSVMQAAKNTGLISGYTHATSVVDMSAALQDQPVIIGISWYSSFDTPASNGVIAISKGAYVRGGHEVEVRGDDPAAQQFFADNSWSASWGLNGSFVIPYAVMERLLAEQGDCTVPVPLSQPAPQPVPPAPADADTTLWATAGPWCVLTRTRPDLVTLKASLQAWAQAKNL